MFRSDDRPHEAPGQALTLFGAIAVCLLLVGMQPTATHAEDGPAYRAPPAGSTPRAGPAAPGAKQRPRSGQGEAPGPSDRDGSPRNEFTPGCPYRDRPLNLLV